MRQDRSHLAADLAFNADARGRFEREPQAAAASVCALLAVAAAYVAHRRGARIEAPHFQKLTFRQGSVGRARWGPAGRGIVFSAAWDGAPRPLLGYEQGDVVADWSGDGRYLFVFKRDQIPAPVVRIEISTGRRDPLCDLAPPDTTGVLGINSILLTPDGATSASSHARGLETLYSVKGLK